MQELIVKALITFVAIVMSLSPFIRLTAAEVSEKPFPLWTEQQPFPRRESLRYPDGASSRMIQRAGADEYQFLHDAAIVEHQTMLVAAWYNCPKGEMQGESLIRGRRSWDGGRTWSDVEVIAADRNRQGILYVPVAFLSYGGVLYAFVTNMRGGPDLVHQCEVFACDDKTNLCRKPSRRKNVLENVEAP
jgi:hypothetical protein